MSIIILSIILIFRYMMNDDAILKKIDLSKFEDEFKLP